MNEALVYDIIYALMACGGREDALFGKYASLGHAAFLQSKAGAEFPELWFELPLVGDPWFDLHFVMNRTGFLPDMTFESPQSGGCPKHPEVFRWAATRERVRSVALSYDLHTTGLSDPGVQLLMGTRGTKEPCEFLEVLGRDDLMPTCAAFLRNLPDGWFGCYTGVFPGRKDLGLRFECIPSYELQQAFAKDPALLERDLRAIGFTDFGPTLIPRCQQLAKTPFQIEFQFDVDVQGKVGSTLGLSLRFAFPSDVGTYQPFDTDAAAGELMRTVQEWGLSDERWRQLEGTMFSKRVSKGSRSQLIYSYVTFIKLRWRDGEPLDAKMYLSASVEDDHKAAAE